MRYARRVTTLQLDPDLPGPLHERIAGSVRRAVASGDLAPGDTLPAARDLAEVVGVNVNTVLRAYRALRDEGVIDLRRGRGATVRATGVDRARLLERLDALVAEATRLGVGRDELTRLLEERT